MTEGMKNSKGAKPLLTIAIPTYNRVRYLRELLSVLFNQLLSEPRVELIVSDNASPDDTPQVVEEYQRRGLQIRSIRHETNIGADANFLQCFEKSRGKYVWIFGDDDVIVEGGVAAILSICEADEYDILYVDHFAVGEVYEPRTYKAGRTPIKMTSSKDFVRRVNVFLTFISGNIINKDRIEASAPPSYAGYVGTQIIQLAWISEALNVFQRGLYIQDKIVGARPYSSVSYNLFKVFAENLKKITDERLHSDTLKRIMLERTARRYWPALLFNYRVFKGGRGNDAGERAIMTGAFGSILSFWLFVYPILVLPIRLAAVWLFFVRVMNRILKAVTVF